MPLDTDTTEEIMLKRRMVELKRQRVRLIKNFGLAFYKPHEKQDAFHRAGVHYKRRMYRAGNRSGKSHMGCAEDCAWLMGERPWYAEGDPARRGGIPQHPVKGLVITQDWDKVDEIWTSERGDSTGKIWKLLPSGFVKSKRRNHSGAIDLIECHNGSILRFDTVKSYMSNPMGSESSDWDFIHVDEPCPEKMFKANARGLVDRGGAAWFTLTPLTEFWINDYFFPEDTRGEAREGVWAVSGSIYDNPFLTPEAIAEYAATLTEDEKQCRLMGIPLHLSGLIYKEFSWDKHVLKEPPRGWDGWMPPLHYSIYYYIDPHPRTPHAVLFCAVDPHGHHFYFYDIFEHCSIEHLSQHINEMVAGRNVVDARVDPLAFINDPVTETNMAEEFWRHGVMVEKATKALSQGILRVQANLQREGLIYFTPACRRTLWEIQRYCWDEDKNKPIDEDDHMMENLYRCELSDPTFVPAGASFPVEDQEITKPNFGLDDLEFA